MKKAQCVDIITGAQIAFVAMSLEADRFKIASNDQVNLNLTILFNHFKKVYTDLIEAMIQSIRNPVADTIK